LPCPISPDQEDIITTIQTTALVPYSTTPVSVTIRFIQDGINGKRVRLQIPQLTGQAVVGGSVFIRVGTGTSIPVNLRPVANTRTVVPILANGVIAAGDLQVTVAGDITLDAIASNFSTGLVGLQDMVVFPYNLP
jgi:hypothetical protein